MDVYPAARECTPRIAPVLWGWLPCSCVRLTHVRLLHETLVTACGSSSCDSSFGGWCATAGGLVPMQRASWSLPLQLVGCCRYINGRDGSLSSTMGSTDRTSTVVASVQGAQIYTHAQDACARHQAMKPCMLDPSKVTRRRCILRARSAWPLICTAAHLHVRLPPQQLHHCMGPQHQFTSRSARRHCTFI